MRMMRTVVSIFLLYVKQRFDKCVCVKLLQVVDMLSDSDVFHRDTKFRMDRHCDAALGRPVQFCQDDAAHRRYSLEFPGLGQCILSGGSIQDNQCLSVCLRLFPFDDAVDLAQLIHQVLLVMKPSGCIHDQDIRILRFRRRDGVIDNRTGV